MFTGQWIRDMEQPLYTNKSCPVMREPRNCFMNGRVDTDFLKWRWQPNTCKLPRSNPKLFLEIFRGKSMAFIGDSVARNHMESLLCLLYQVPPLFFLTIKFSEFMFYSFRLNCMIRMLHYILQDF